MPELVLPRLGGGLERYRTGEPASYLISPPSRSRGRDWNRVAYAAAHVVADPRSDASPWDAAALDWDATLEHRRHLWDLGLGVAEAMDTAQRGTGLDWDTSRELIRRTLDEAKARPGAVVACGAGTDHLEPGRGVRLEDIVRAYEEQVAFIGGLGGRVVLMASRALAACATSRDDYLEVYDKVLRQVRAPVILHWLGEMFDPALRGYWGTTDRRQAMAVCLGLIHDHPGRIDGIKVSLLDRDLEVEMRRRLPAGVRMLTGDDFAFAELIEGDDQGHSDALLGIFDGIAPAAAAALDALGRDDRETYRRILAPMVPLSRHVFAPPTRYYKTGLVFLAWLCGRQDHFVMVGGLQSARSLVHLAELFRLADRAGLLPDPPLACDRMRHLLAMHGV